MPYTFIDRNKPDPGDSREEVIDGTRENINAIADMILGGGTSGTWSYAVTAGTAAKPTTIVLTNQADTNIRFRWILTYDVTNTNFVTALAVAKTVDGSNYDTIASYTFGYTAKELTSGNIGGMVLARVMQQFAMVRDLRDEYNAHTDGGPAGRAQHNLGTMSTQNMDGVDIDAGFADNLVIGGTVPNLGSFLQVREVDVVVSFNAGAGATTTINLALGASFNIVASGSGASTLAFSNPPAANRNTTIVLWLSNGGLRTWTWPTGSKFAGGTPPALTASGVDILTATSRDGGATWHWTLASKDSR